jgi:hypothetical protein
MTHRFTPGPESKAPPREWHNDGPDLRTNAVCEVCNTGWLSDLEAAASPLVGPMIVGEVRALQTEDQKTLAAWAYKTVLLMQMVRPPELRVIPTQRFEQLHEIATRSSSGPRQLREERIGPLRDHVLAARLAVLAAEDAGHHANLDIGPVLSPVVVAVARSPGT